MTLGVVRLAGRNRDRKYLSLLDKVFTIRIFRIKTASLSLLVDHKESFFMSSLSDVLGKLKQDEEVTFRRERDKLSIRYMRELHDGRRWAGAVFLVPEMSGYAQFDHFAMVLG